MNIAVYCGSNFGNNGNFETQAKNLGQWMGMNGHTLIYGGAKVGLMGALANEVLKNNGEVIGVMPTILASTERVHNGLTELVMVDTMSERKNKMIELSQCFIALPGGPGTLEEISEVISWARIGQHQFPCIIFNIDGYYDPLKQLFENMVTSNFITSEQAKVVIFIESISELDMYVSEVIK